MHTFRQYLTERAKNGKDTIVLSFGRFNPPHRGHKLLTDLLVKTAEQEHGDNALYVKGRQGPKDPLLVDDKIKYLEMFTPGLHVYFDARYPDPPDVVKHYSDLGYERLVLVVGGDRVDKLTNDIQNSMASGRYGFKDFRIVSAGDRAGAEMWSGTQQRELAQADDFTDFRKNLPPNFPESAAREMFAKVRKGLELSEERSFAQRVLTGMWEETIYPANSLGLSREEMPQIRLFDLPEFLDFLRNNHVSARDEIVPAAELKPTQKEINGDKARAFKPGFGGSSKPLLVSRDGYIMDGHHRWMNAVWNKQMLPITRLGADIRDLLKLARKFPKTEYHELAHSFYPYQSQPARVA
jgi:hypothetical protein